MPLGANAGFFALDAHDPRVLLAASLAVGIIQLLKWLSDLRSRRKNPWRVVGDIGLAMSLIWGWAAVLFIFNQLNMSWLVLGVLSCGFIGRDLFDKEAQAEVRTGAVRVIKALIDAFMGGGSKDGDKT